MHQLAVAAEPVFFEYCNFKEYREKEYTKDEFNLMSNNRRAKLEVLKSAFITEIKRNLLEIQNPVKYLNRILIEANELLKLTNSLVKHLGNKEHKMVLSGNQIQTLINEYYMFYFLDTGSANKHLMETIKSYLVLEQAEILPGNMPAPTPTLADLGTQNIDIMIKRMSWNGDQKQLGELFVELKRKGWINEFSYKAIKQCFTQSDTIQQVLKPGQDPKKLYEPTYEGVYKGNYDPKFYAIKDAPKKKITS